MLTKLLAIVVAVAFLAGYLWLGLRYARWVKQCLRDARAGALRGAREDYYRELREFRKNGLLHYMPETPDKVPFTGGTEGQRDARRRARDRAIWRRDMPALYRYEAEQAKRKKK